MRISSMQIFDIARKSMASASQDMAKTQEQMSTRKRVLTAADDPIAAVKIMQLKDELRATEQYKKNIDSVEYSLGLQETVLAGVESIIQSVQERAVAAGNTGTLTPSDYQSMADETGVRLEQLVDLLNTRNTNGDYIFGGFKSAQAPFSGSAQTGYTYQGDEGQKFIKVANGSSIAATDSGKAAFMDVASAFNTFVTSASPSNRSDPPVQISLGQIVDQDEYDKFHPEDIVITFNPDENGTPPGKNFTAVERSTGRVIVANQTYVPGQEVEMHGASFRIIGGPVSGRSAVPATQAFGSGGATAYPVDFSTAPQTFTMTVGGRKETLVLDSQITNPTELADVLNDPNNGNAAKLAKIGIVVDQDGFSMPHGVNFSIDNGSAAIDAVLGLNSSGGSSSTDGVKQQAGDQLFIEATGKQDILTTIARFQEAMASYDGSEESKQRLSDTVAATLDNLSNAQTSAANVATKIGARINRLDSVRELHLDSEIINNDILSQLEDLDYAEATVRLSQQTMVLEAAQQSFIRTSQLSLFARL